MLSDLKALTLIQFLFKKLLWGEQDSNLRSLKTTDLQSVLVGRLSISPNLIIHQSNQNFIEQSRWRDSNPRPADYKSAALAS